MPVEDYFKIQMTSYPFLTFNKEGEEVGVFDYVDGEWTFKGDADESAKIFIEAIKDNLEQWLTYNGWSKDDE